MEQQLCLNCNTPIEGKEGKRAKKYCNDACRASHWSKLNKKGQKWVKREVYEELLERYKALEAQVNTPNISMPVFYELPKPITFDTKKFSNPFNLPYSNEGKEEAIEPAAKEKKPPVIKDKGANKNTRIKKGKNTYWAEIKKCSTRETIESKRAEVHADTNLNYQDVPFLNNACDRQLLTIKQ